MTQDELEENSYRWAYHYAFKDMAWKPIPEKPEFYLYFLRKTENARKKIWEEDMKQRNRILAYLGEVDDKINANRANYQFLKEMIKFFDSKKETVKVEDLITLKEGFDVKVVEVQRRREIKY